MEFYTYIWRDASGVPFYVGKGKGSRAHQVVGRRSAEFLAIHAQGGCTVEIADRFILESQAHAHEMELIEKFGRRDIGAGTLVNKTDGGEGASGSVRSAEHKAKIGAAHRGKPRSTRDRARISAAVKEAMAPPMVRAKISAATKAAMAASPQHTDSRSGYKGVTFHARDKHWRARITIDGKQRDLGAFRSAIEAARTYDAAVIASGSGGYLNLPKEIAA